MKCFVCDREFDDHEDEDVCPTCRKIASEKTIEYLRREYKKKRRFEKNKEGGKK